MKAAIAARAIRYEIDLHPDAVDFYTTPPNAWLCQCYDEQDRLISQHVGDTPKQALERALAAS